MGIGPIVIGYDGSPASRRVIDESGALLTHHEALVVVVWEAGLGFATVENVPEIPAVPLDIRAALETEKALYEGARQLAHEGVQLAEKAGLEATGLVVADDVTIAETLVRVANEHDAQAIALGTDGIGLPARVAGQHDARRHPARVLPGDRRAGAQAPVSKLNRKSWTGGDADPNVSYRCARVAACSASSIPCKWATASSMS